MKRRLSIAIGSLAAVFVMAIAASAQSAFSDPNAQYTFNLPDAKWKLTLKPTATQPNVQYVFMDRTYGHLEVRKIAVQKSDLLTDVIRQEEEKLALSLRGYVAGNEENFTGKFRGVVFNFEYVQDAKQMSGRYYFLRANDNTVYLLRFRGQKDSLRSIRDQTDSIARTFATT
jgi:hypothetical protein